MIYSRVQFDADKGQKLACHQSDRHNQRKLAAGGKNIMDSAGIEVPTSPSSRACALFASVVLKTRRRLFRH